METQEVENSTRNAWIFYEAYLSAVGQELGMGKALELHSDSCQLLGRLHGQMIRQHSDKSFYDAKAAYSLMMTAPKSFGTVSEVVEESRSRVLLKCGECPFYEAGLQLGLREDVREDLCRDGSALFLDSLVKQLNPRLSYRIRKYRSSSDDCCEEEIVLEDS